MNRTQKTSWLLWGVFGVLVLCSALSLLHAFAVVGLTPMMVYDSAESIPKLPATDLSALCRSVSRYTGRVAGHSSATVIAWVLFSGFLLFRDRRLNHAGTSDEKSS
jgi:hypothetical protein